jgi:hypothetical protein
MKHDECRGTHRLSIQDLGGWNERGTYDTISSFIMSTPLKLDVFVVAFATGVGLDFLFCLTKASILRHGRSRGVDAAACERQVSWVITFLTSAVVCVAAWSFTPPVLHLLWTHDTEGLVAWLSTETLASRALAVFFLTALVSDSYHAQRDYPRAFKFLEGTVHHAFYVCLLAWVIGTASCNAFAAYVFLLLACCIYFLSHCMNCISCMHCIVCRFAVCEVPTFLLANGQIDADVRQDFAFGVTFFATRIVWFGVLGRFILLHPVSRVYALAVVPVFCVHVWWFCKWLLKSGHAVWLDCARPLTPPCCVSDAPDNAYTSSSSRDEIVEGDEMFDTGILRYERTKGSQAMACAHALGSSH